MNEDDLRKAILRIPANELGCGEGFLNGVAQNDFGEVFFVLDDQLNDGYLKSTSPDRTRRKSLHIRNGGTRFMVVLANTQESET